MIALAALGSGFLCRRKYSLLKKIIGIFLVRNEDRFIKQAINNVITFCDEILLVDHTSTDGTLEILRCAQEQHPKKISLYQIAYPRDTHDLLKKYAGTATWIFGVDGDEIYDPERLIIFRQRLLSGEFDDVWMILGNVLHVDQFEEEQKSASGYLAPPSRSITKLYNFSAIDTWEGNTIERLHGGTPHFRSGFDAQKKRLLQNEYLWNEAPLRCLHLCFLPRSSKDQSLQRKNIMELYTADTLALLRKGMRYLLGLPQPASWKQEHYRRGEKHTVDTRPFFNKA